MKALKSQNLTFFIPELNQDSGVHFFDTGISAGFPSPAEDFKEERLSLDDELIKNSRDNNNNTVTYIR